MADPIVSLTQILAQFSQNVAEMGAHLRNARDGAGGAINGFYAEAKRYLRSFDEGRGLRYRPAVITLSGAIATAGVGASTSDNFRVAQNEDFLVLSVRGMILSSSMPTEPGGGAFTAPFLNSVNTLTPSEILLTKAQNCLVTIQNKDTKVPITENHGISLANITPEVGGEILRFQPDIVPGYTIPHNTTIEALFALQSANLFFNTISTTYGVMLAGLYVSREVR